MEADEALRLGLVTRLAGDPSRRPRRPPPSWARSRRTRSVPGKRLLNEAWGPEPGDILARETALQRELLGSPNQIAAVQAALSNQSSPAEFSDPE